MKKPIDPNDIDWAGILIQIGIGLFFAITLVRCALA